MMSNTCLQLHRRPQCGARLRACISMWPRKKTMEVVAGASGISTQDRASWAVEGTYGNAWAQTIWADMFG